MKTRCGEIEAGVYGSIPRLKMVFPLDSLGILVQLDLEIPLRKNLSPVAKNITSSLFL